MKKLKFTKKQQLVLDNLPWVHYLCKPRPCTGWMSSGKKCKNPAHWRFTSLKIRRKWGYQLKNGIFCWSHLIHRGIYGSMEEEERTKKRFYETGVLCQSISPSGVRCSMLADHEDEEHFDRCWTEPYSDDPKKLHYGEVWT